MKANNKNISNTINFRLPALLAIALSATLVSAYADDSKDNSSDNSSKASQSGDNNSEDNKASDDSSNKGTVSSVQSKADPLKLPIVGKVMAASSTEASKSFDSSVLPAALKYVQANLPEAKNNTKSQAVVSVDPAKLVLASKTDLQAIFVSEGASYHNTLGFNTTGTGIKTGNPEIIFPDASSSVGAGNLGKDGKRTPSEPLLPGDFVNLGTYDKGTKLDFFLIADGANGGTTVYNSNGANPDGLNHVGMFTPKMFAVPELNSPYIFVSFEDLKGGGDKDYNDVVFAFNVGAQTVHNLLCTPEPSMYLTLGGFLALGIWAKRRMDKLAPATQA